MLICPAFAFLKKRDATKNPGTLGFIAQNTGVIYRANGVSVGVKAAGGCDVDLGIKLDGYRVLAVKSSTGLTLFSRNRKSIDRQFPYIVEALADLPEGTVEDGELVAIDDRGRLNFNLLHNFRTEAARIHHYVFDLLHWMERDLTRPPLIERRALLKGLLVVQDTRIRIADYVEAAPRNLLAAVREQSLEGIVGKQKDSHYQPGKRSGAWIKYRVNRAQGFVIAGYFPGPHGFESVIVGYYDGDKLM